MKYVLLAVLILLLFGTKKLPELGRSFGESLREFKDATKGLADEDETKTDR
ncbi:twin-arginine translocase TatA/TatE family subunit [Geobacillus sp. FSL W8-0032]|uniref:Sec-independent protein translocase protein TatA n=1 Tax=Geobacillus icigianus TaxID=1430331 RepID=A0ABU6BL10_9BACL|nr:twin-arginine translocase TatA/TatE family subunit [Geobacillus icigianus]MEB3752537.1 Sec-independent protein translocase protein TatAy [Geobacillus icigianus]